MKLKVKKVNDLAILPQYQTKGAAAFDLHSVEEFTIQSGDTATVSTGLVFEIPEGYYLEIAPRSSISLNTRTRVLKGIVDSDFRGEVKIIVENLYAKYPDPYMIVKGQRVAQALLKKVERAEIEEVEEVSTTERNTKGFGSTGY